MPVQDQQNVVEGEIDHVLDGQVSEEGDVRGQDDVIKIVELLNLGFIGQAPFPSVGLEDRAFPLDGIEGRSGDCALFQSLDQVGGIDHGSPTGVDQARGWLHQGKVLGS